MPAMALTGCETDYSLPSDAFVAVCITEDLEGATDFDSRTLGYLDRATYAIDDVCSDDPNQPDPFFKGKLFRSLPGSKRPADDYGPAQSTGVDAATLRPQAVDLDIFPSIPISEELSLKPSLSYSEDVCMTRLGRVHFGAPKEWRNHHGELVILMAGTFQSQVAINQLEDRNLPPSPGTNSSVPESRELQLFFVNATGQQVNFYPDPANFPNLDDDTNPNDDQIPNMDKPNGRFQYWYSNSGNYRLEDLNFDSTTSDHFNFELKTPTGLTLTFERYRHEMDTKRESLALRFRVTKIFDRYGNYLEVAYHNLNGDPDLRPRTVKAYKKDGVNKTTPIHTLEYNYFTDGRLSNIEMPNYLANSSTNIYRFYYPDAGSIHPDMPARHEVNSVVPTAVPLTQINGVWRAQVPPLVTNVAGISASGYNIFLDFDALGFAPEPVLDFNSMTGDEGLDFTDAGYGFRYQYNPQSGPSQSGFYRADDTARQGKRFARRNEGSPSLSYRYQIDQYPATVNGTTYPDSTTLNIVSGDAFPLDTALSFDVLPILKDGDALVWQSGNQLKSLEVNLVDGDAFDQDNNYAVKLRGSDNPAGATNVRLVREDNRNRIAEIQFPASASSTHKRMVFQYDDQSLNHQEIKSVQVFDVNATHAQLLAETSYEYEHLLIQAQALDLEETLPRKFAGNEGDKWRNCIPDKVLGDINLKVDLLGRHELIDMVRQKSTRYLKSWRPLDAAYNSADYETLTSHFGGAYRFALMGRSLYDSNRFRPDYGDCDYMEWGLAAKPFYFTWQINPDGTGAVFDLSPKGLGLEPALAHANRYRRTFKTYKFDNRFKDYFISDDSYTAPFESYTKFGNSSTFTPVHKYMLPYSVAANCTSCSTPPTMEDLINNPPDSPLAIPTLADFFSGSAKCYEADWSTHELVPIYNYAIDSDATDPSRFMRRWNIHALHGSIVHITQYIDSRLMRVSPVAVIDGNSTTTAEEADLVELFFRGDLETCATRPTNISLGTFDWNYGGRTDLGAVFQYARDREKTHQLRPHAQFKARDLDGLSWNAAGFINLEVSNGKSPLVVEATRASNGGFLGHSQANAALEGASQLTLNTAVSGSVQPGDVFYNYNMIYSVTGINGSVIDFEPALREEVVANQIIPFHRFYRGKFPDSKVEPDNGYMGYDAFGNNGFSAMYKKDNLHFVYSDEDHALVPDFFYDQNGVRAEPFQILLTDATHPSNNDTSDWQYFGRVTKQYSGSELPFNDYTTTSGTLVSGWNTGHWSTFTYSGQPYPWTATGQVSWYRPKILPAGLTTPNGLSADTFYNYSNPQSHVEDRRSEIRYYAPFVANSFLTGESLNYGRVAATWLGQERHIALFDQIKAQRFDYDERGRPTAIYDAGFSMNGNLGTSPYGTAQTFSYLVGSTDTLMNLPTQTQTKAIHASWNTGSTLIAGRFTVNDEALELTQHVNYDALGRVVKNYSSDASGVDYGAVVDMTYPSQTKVIEESSTPGGPVFSKNTNYLDGRGQALISLRQRSGELDQPFAQVNDYDGFGRLLHTGFVRDVDSFTTPDNYAQGASAGSGARTTNVFNRRSEVFGQVVFNEDGTADSSTWTHSQQNAAGNLVIHQIEQSPDDAAVAADLPNLSGIAVKRMTQDDLGMVERVEDFLVNQATSGIWTTFNSDSDLAPFLPASGDTQLTQATYQYDRWENVRKVDVGLINPQERIFSFDQRSRLRREEHPEVRATASQNATAVTYDQFTLFDNAESIGHGSNRTWTHTYNPAGDLVSLDANGIVTTYTYRHQITGAAQTAISFAGLPTMIRHEDGDQVVYLHEYDSNRGWLLSRTMFHQFDRFDDFGYVADLHTKDYGDLTTSPLSDEGLELAQTFDILGRVKTKKYPSAIQGLSANTELDHVYDSDSQMLQKIGDKALANPYFTLVEDITYDRLDRISQAKLFKPGGNSGIHQIKRAPDDLNRIQSWNAVWQDNLAQPAHLDEARTYQYDQRGRMAQIKRDGAQLYSYGYDSLGQIRQAQIKPDPTSTAVLHEFTYDDSSGLGNLIEITRDGTATSFSVDAATNHLVGFTYNEFGEQESDSRDGITYSLNYDALGRLSDYRDSALPVSAPPIAAYFYDQDGLRIHTTTPDELGNPEERLYFYDENMMVLSEWVAREDNGNWQDHWDKTYLYLEDQSTFTYEYDEATASGVTEGMSLPQAVIVQNDILSWTGTAGPYQLEIADDQMQPVREFKGVKDASFNFSKRLKYGKYHVRIKSAASTWGDWQEVFYMDSTSQDLVGHFEFDSSGDDSSYYRNHLGDLSNIGYSEGAYWDALDIDPGEQITLEDPHRFHSSSGVSTISFWMKIPPLPNAFVARERRLLWDYDWVALWADNHGGFEIKPKGKSYESATLGITPDTWEHITLIYGSGTAKLYVNGQLALDSPTMGGLIHGDMWLGGLSASTGFDGEIDRLRIFNRALTSTEIQTEATP